jgi:CBS domain-containing protein
MKARDVMVSPVITTKPSASVKEVAHILLTHRISAVPVVDDAGKLVGIVSEGDLMRRADLGTERHRSWWLAALFAEEEALAAEYVKQHSKKVSDVMTKHIVAATPDTPLNEIAGLLERHSIKRVPIVDNDALVGIVSRANIIQAGHHALGSREAGAARRRRDHAGRARRQRQRDHADLAGGVLAAHPPGGAGCDRRRRSHFPSCASQKGRRAAGVEIRGAGSHLCVLVT